jgi:hypothetical protein
LHVAEKAKPATVSSEPALIVEQLGGPLGKKNTDSLTEHQARSLRHRFALGYHFAASVAPLIWGASAMNPHVKPPALKLDSEYLLAALRCTSRRLKLIDEEVILIGMALKKELITPEAAIEQTEEIAPGCLSVVAASMGGAE